MFEVEYWDNFDQRIAKFDTAKEAMDFAYKQEPGWTIREDGKFFMDDLFMEDDNV